MEPVTELLVYRTPNESGDGVCKVEMIPLKDGRRAVILEELDDNPGQSVSQALESIVARVQRMYNINPREAVWIEHDPDPQRMKGNPFERWQIITFTPPRAGQIQGDAKWRNMTVVDWQELGLPVRE